MSRLLVDSLLSVMFPPVCPCCGMVLTRGETSLCIGCRLKLPETGYERQPADNEMLAKLNGLAPVCAATAWFTYRRDSPQARIIHDIKYRGRPSLGRRLAAEYSRAIRATGFFDGIDAIVPVPLNFWRHCRRGYNQAHYIACGVADAVGVPVIDALTARRHGSQTRLNAVERLGALRGVYAVRKGALAGVGHVLIVDDICTTGATLYACAEAIHQEAPGVAISVLTLASTALG